MRSGGLGTKLRWTGALSVACLLASAAIAPGQGRSGPVEISDLRELEHAFTQLADRVRASAVSIRTYALGPFIGSRRDGPAGEHVRWLRSYGTGAVIRGDGQILTSAHVIEGADVIVLTLHDGREFDARLLRADQRSDLAVLEIDAQGLQPVRFSDLARVRQGQWCFVVGNPFGLSSMDGRAALTYGLVSALDRDLSSELNTEARSLADQRDYGSLLQTSAAINPGNSGGPLFNLDGEVIGVVTAIESRSGVTEGVGFAIPISRETRRVIELLSRGEEVRYGYLGVQVERPDRAARREAGLPRGRGALITRLDPPDGPAANARLRPGDIIVEFNGTRVEGTNHLVRIVQATPVGQAAEVAYLRNGKRRTARVTMAARPVSQVLVGADGSGQEPKTSRWRGVWLAEPTEAILQAIRREFGIARDQMGLVVLEVEPDSDAAKAGLQGRQIVFKLNQRRVRTIEEFLSAAGEPGSTAVLEVSSEGTTKTIRLPATDE